MNLTELRKAVKQLGLSGYSKMTKPQLQAALALVEVHRGDLKATRKLGSAYLRTCQVGQWRNKGSKSRPYWEPLSWLVRAGILTQQDITPISEDEARENRNKMSATAKVTYSRRLEKARKRIGAITGSRTARDLAFGNIDVDFAELISFRAKYRHEHTNYNVLIRKTKDKDFARQTMSGDSIPEDWRTYLERYGFHGEVAEALVRTLDDPCCCHPVWFKEAEIAVRREALDLGELTYESIQSAIFDWRDERHEE